MSGISVWQLVIIFVILLLLFGSKKIRNIGSDLGHSIKSFRKSVREDDKDDASDKNEANQQSISQDEEKADHTDKHDK